ncbi:hydrogenase maturation nickel metallochaperone HypA [candidate division KSB1 bacterium]|nr:hydrogenase maturation nickel metallochaperone HypA [candidate division KSB1 bacterium]
MHELYIAQCIIDGVRRSLPAEVPADEVQAVAVRVGQLDAVVPDTLRFLFDAIKVDAGLIRAQLEIEVEPVQLTCNHCGDRFTIDEPVFRCPRCAGANVATLAGRGITLQRIAIADPIQR